LLPRVLAALASRGGSRSADGVLGTLFNHLRSRNVESNVFETGDITTAPDPGPTASRIVAKSEEQVLLLRAMQALEPDVQTLIVLFYWEELKVAELSEVFGVGVSTITTRLSRARTALQNTIAGLPAVSSHSASLLRDLDAWLRSVPALDLASSHR
jgi:DNA-directed RNA polymerase specialized sigma24 family protein